MAVLKLILAALDEEKRKAVETIFGALPEDQRMALESALDSGYDRTIATRTKTLKESLEAEFVANRFDELYKKRLETEHPELANDPIRRQLAETQGQVKALLEQNARKEMFNIAFKELGEYAVKGLVDPNMYLGKTEEETRQLAKAQLEKLETWKSELIKTTATNEAARFQTPPPAGGGVPTGTNPWKTGNLTEQAAILERDPAQAAALKQAAQTETTPA